MLKLGRAILHLSKRCDQKDSRTRVAEKLDAGSFESELVFLIVSKLAEIGASLSPSSRRTVDTAIPD